MPDAAGAVYKLRLYVSGTTSRSARAIANIRGICERHLGHDCELEVVDIYQHPEAARDHQILAAPTLVKLSPDPIRRIIGDLSDHARTLSLLGVAGLIDPNGSAHG